MTYAWFVCGYELKADRPWMRFCTMDNFSAQIAADGGNWSESEVLGGNAVVKVQASDTTIAAIAAAPGFSRMLTKWALTDTLADLTTAQRNALNTKLLGLGYSQAEINTALGATLADWRGKTLGALLRFAATRRLTPRWDSIQQQIVLDGEFVACRPIHEVDASVP